MSFTLTILLLCSALATALVLCEGVSPWCRKFLPLGGSHLAQVGFVFGGGWVTVELIEAFHAYAVSLAH